MIHLYSKLYTLADFDEDYGPQHYNFYPRSERQWAYTMLMMDGVDWIVINGHLKPGKMQVLIHGEIDPDVVAERMERYRPVGTYIDWRKYDLPASHD